MKKLNFSLLLFFVIFFSTQGKAQENYENFYQAGPVVKVLTARMALENEQIDLSEGGSELGYQFGGFFRVNVKNVYVQPSVLLSKVKTELVFLNYEGVPNFNPRADFEFNTLELPVDIRVRIGNLRMQMGPSFSILLSGQRSFLNDVEEVSYAYNGSNLMWHFGLGGDFDRFLIDFNYEFGLSKTGESLAQLIGRDFVPQQRQWIISVAINFLN